MITQTGTPYYMAPEVIKGSYDEMCDMWSIGVITFAILGGYPPFNIGREQPDSQLYNKILTCDYEFDEEIWEDVSEEAKDFIQKLLEPNREKRMKPEEAIKHKWIQQNSPDKELDVGILE